MKKERNLNPFVGLLIIVLLYLLASTMTRQEIEEDRQAQEDCRLEDTVNNNITYYYNE